MSSRGNPGKWDLPGGKVDAGESFHDGLLREVLEETGLTISVKRVVGAAESESPAKRVAYLILEGAIESGELRLSDEHDESTWVRIHDLTNVDLVDQFKAFARSYVQTEEQQQRNCE